MALKSVVSCSFETDTSQLTGVFNTLDTCACTQT